MTRPMSRDAFARAAGAALTAMVLLAGCGTPPPTRPVLIGDDEAPEYQACRAEAEKSPALRALAKESYPANNFNQDRMVREQQVALNKAYRDCLRARGLAMPGGVESVIRR